MEIRILNKEDIYWNRTIEMAEKCSWRVGANLGKRMRENIFKDFECPFAAVENNEVIGFCTITKTDYIPNCTYTPWIGFVFVDEKYRGNRSSEKMIKKVFEYAKSEGFEKIYIATGEDNLYEKYGFVQVDTLKSYGNTLETILMYELK